jgi:hypothetical protein
MVAKVNDLHAKPTRKILLYGNSILIAGLTSKLLQVEGWEVLQMEHGEPDDLISAVDIVVADLRDVKTSQALPMLCAIPGVLLVGMDAFTNTLTVLTGQSHPAHSMQDVLDVLKDAM